MPVMERAVGEMLNIAVRNPQVVASSTMAPSQTSTAPAPAATTSQGGGGGGGGPTSSPLLFFVALGFGVVFTNLWIIVGVKYCFRYNARNRALRNGEDVDQINMENMPRPHRRRREKKLMTMDEVNERFPLTKYKNWVANRMNAGLPATGGVTAPPSRAGSVRDLDAAMPSSPVDTKHTITRPGTANSEAHVTPIVDKVEVKKDEDKVIAEKDKTPVSSLGEQKPAETTDVPAKRVTSATSLDDDDDEDDHIHTAVPPELLTNPGDSCAICIDTLEDDDDIRGLTCGHAFHAGCLDPWLTSRRACCPLCKADYFTPKPRPEGEAIDLTDRAARRREARGNQPQPPRSRWAGLRAPRTLFLARFGDTPAVDQQANDNEATRSEQRERRAAAATQTQQSRPSIFGNVIAPRDAPAPAPAPAPAQSRWRNPFTSVRLPGRSTTVTAGQPIPPTAEPSPSQLEAGTAAPPTAR